MNFAFDGSRPIVARRNRKRRRADLRGGRLHDLARQIVNTVIEKGECDFVAEVAGEIANKSAAVSFFTPQNAMTSGRLDYVHIRVFGDAAIAQGQETDIRPKASALSSGRLIFTDVWLLRRGEWRIVNSEDQFQPLEQPVGH